MSSSSVRTAFKTFIGANIGVEKLVDISGEFSEFKDLLRQHSIASGEVFTAIEFITGDEQPITIGSTNTQGKYREHGGVAVYVLGLSRLGGWDSINTRAEALRDKLRGQRLGLDQEISVESLTTQSSNDGASLNFEGGYTSATFYVEYISDKNF